MTALAVLLIIFIITPLGRIAILSLLSKMLDCVWFFVFIGLVFFMKDKR